jgi:chemotaxis protein CheZ
VSNASQENEDSDDLEALFDSIALANTEPPPAAPKPAAAKVSDPEPAAASDGICSNEKVYSQLGHMTRSLHDSLRELGYDKALESAASSIPDARDRLNYIATMTEQAAERALNATEIAKPIQDKLSTEASALSEQWQRLFDKQLDVDRFKNLVTQTRDYLNQVPQHTQATNAQLMEIMMAQDFQDLTGQVIKKIIDVAQQIEGQLLQLLVETTPPSKMTEVNSGLLNGPVIQSDGRSDVVTNQAQVDEFLDSLGF